MKSAVILAGGLGMRLRSAVNDLPKPMAPINGRPFLEHQIDYWIKQGISHFVLSVGYRHEMIIDHFGNRYKDAELEYVIERIPLGTGGGFLLASEKIGKNDPFVLLNGDTYFPVDLSTLCDFSIAQKADWCFSLLRNPDHDRYMGIETTGEGRVTQLQSLSSPLINGGVYFIQPSFLQKLSFQADKPVSLENEILPSALKSGLGLFGLEFSAPFIDIGVPADYSRAQDELPNLIRNKGNP